MGFPLLGGIGVDAQIPEGVAAVVNRQRLIEQGQGRRRAAALAQAEPGADERLHGQL